MSGESMHRPSLGRRRCVWGSSYWLPGPSHTLSSRTPLQGWPWLSLSCCVVSSRLRACRTFRLAGGGQGLVDGWLEAAHVLHGGTVSLHGLHVLVQDGKNLIVQDLVLPDPVCHFFQRLQRTRPSRLGVGGGDRGIKGEQEKNSARLGSRVLVPQGSHHSLA